MSRIVIFTTGLASHLHSALELGRRLREAGHELTYVSSARIGEIVAAAGQTFQRLTAAEALEAELPEIDAERTLFRRLSRRRRQRMRSIENHEVEDLLAKVQPDLLLVHPEMHFVIVSVAACGIPTVLMMNWFGILPRKGLPSLSSTLLPQPGIGGQLRTAWTWLSPLIDNRLWRLQRLLSVKGMRRLFRIVHYDTRDYSDLKAIARARGYPLRRETTLNSWLRPVFYRNLPVLSFTAWEMEFPHSHPTRVHYVGPMIQMGRQEPLTNTEDVNRLRRFMGIRDPRQSLIYCSLGSFVTNLDLLRKVTNVFRRRQDWRLILGLGLKADVESLGAIPPNILPLNWAPQLEILKNADCAIVHGGSSTLHECIMFTTPMLIYPTRPNSDVNGNAARVHYYRLGIRADKDKDSDHEIEEKLEALLGDCKIQQRLRRMKAAFDRYSQSGTAVACIESYLHRNHR